MNWSQIESGWSNYKGTAKQQWGKLTDEQIADTLGKREQLASKVQEVYGISKEETEKQITSWQSRQLEQQPVPAAK